MAAERIYDPEIEKQAREFPRFNFADAEGTRSVIRELNEAALADGFVRCWCILSWTTAVRRNPGTVHGFDFLMTSQISSRAVNEGVNAFKRAVRC